MWNTGGKSRRAERPAFKHIAVDRRTNRAGVGLLLALNRTGKEYTSLRGGMLISSGRIGNENAIRPT